MDTNAATPLINKLTTLAQERGPRMGAPAMSAEAAMELAHRQMSAEDAERGFLGELDDMNA